MFSEIAHLPTKKSFLYSGRECVIKEYYDVRRVQTLEERLEDMDSLFLHVWLTKFVQEVANKK